MMNEVSFCMVQKLTQYDSFRCKNLVTAGKQTTINQTPMMLAVHLKRFAFDMERGYMRKINSTIKYPQKLDLARYTSKESKVTGTSYSLYAIVVHLGHGCDSGHYYAYVKSPEGKWYCMDDEDVQPANIEEVLSQNAYMLFYQQDQANIPSEKKKTTVPEPTPIIIETPPIVPVKPAIKDTTVSKPAAVKKVHIETVYADNPSEWVTQSADKPFRSLRGKMSPPTYGAAVSDVSSWQQNDLAGFERQQKLRKRRRIRKNLEAKKSLWRETSF